MKLFLVVALWIVNRLMHGLGRYFGDSCVFHRLLHVARLLRVKHRFLKIGERDDDIYIAAYMKSGTTWAQMILYQLTTDGNMDFGHIYDVSPWLEVDAPSMAEFPAPRVIKTHLSYRHIPRHRKGRFIFLSRDGRDVAVSMYHHQKSYAYDPPLTFDEVFAVRFGEAETKNSRTEGPPNWFTYTDEWLNNRYERKILYLHYEDMKADLEGVMRRIIDFCELKVDEKEFPRILERSGFAFMKRHEQKFGEQPQPGDPDHKVYDNFLRKGQVGDWRRYLSEEQERYFEERLQAMNWGRFPHVRPAV
jgi:hypothetical protein